MNVPTLDQFDALLRRVSALEARAARPGSGWMRLSVSPLGARKLRRLIAAGKLEAARVGRLLLVRVDDHDRFLEARVVRRDAPKPVPTVTDDPVGYASANMHMLRRVG